MTKLTRREQRTLEVTGNVVRMYVAVITVLFPILCFGKANWFYANTDVPQIPQAATYGTIVGIYFPLFAAVAAYVWATRAYPKRQAAPHGYAMALFRDAFTLVVVTTVLYVPVRLYGSSVKTIQEVNTLLVWYQTVITAGAGAAFAYYFHASLTPARAAPSEPTAGSQRRPTQRRRDAEARP